MEENTIRLVTYEELSHSERIEAIVTNANLQLKLVNGLEGKKALVTLLTTCYNDENYNSYLLILQSIDELSKSQNLVKTPVLMQMLSSQGVKLSLGTVRNRCDTLYSFGLIEISTLENTTHLVYALTDNGKGLLQALETHCKEAFPDRTSLRQQANTKATAGNALTDIPTCIEIITLEMEMKYISDHIKIKRNEAGIIESVSITRVGLLILILFYNQKNNFNLLMDESRLERVYSGLLQKFYLKNPTDDQSKKDIQTKIEKNSRTTIKQLYPRKKREQTSSFKSSLFSKEEQQYAYQLSKKSFNSFTNGKYQQLRNSQKISLTYPKKEEVAIAELEKAIIKTLGEEEEEKKNLPSELRHPTKTP